MQGNFKNAMAKRAQWKNANPSSSPVLLRSQTNKSEGPSELEISQMKNAIPPESVYMLPQKIGNATKLVDLFKKLNSKIDETGEQNKKEYDKIDDKIENMIKVLKKQDALLKSQFGIVDKEITS